MNALLYLCWIMLLSGAIILYVFILLQRRLHDELTEAEGVSARHRVEILAQDEGAQRQTITALKQELQISNTSRYDLLHYIERFEKPLVQKVRL